jgi:hypothetical protein
MPRLGQHWHDRHLTNGAALALPTTTHYTSLVITRRGCSPASSLDSSPHGRHEIKYMMTLGDGLSNHVVIKSRTSSLVALLYNLQYRESAASPLTRPAYHHDNPHIRQPVLKRL